MSKEKQIEEMARFMCGDCADYGTCEYNVCEGNLDVATDLYNAGYRKQSEGENVATYPSSAFECSECHWQDWDLLTADSAYNFCPNCGAKMKGGVE